MLTITVELPGGPDVEKQLGHLVHLASVVFGGRAIVENPVFRQLETGDVVGNGNNAKALSK